MIRIYGDYKSFPTEEEAHSEKALTDLRMSMLDCVKEICEYCDVIGIKSEFPIYSTLGENYTVGWKVIFTFQGEEPPREVRITGG